MTGSEEISALSRISNGISGFRILLKLADWEENITIIYHLGGGPGKRSFDIDILGPAP